LREAKQDYSNKAPAKDNIIDTIFFDVVAKIHESCLTEIRALLGGAQSRDRHLEMFHDQIMKSADYNNDATVDAIFQAELKHLKLSLKKVRDVYASNFPGKSSHSSHTDYIERIKQLRILYDAIQPLQPDHPAIREWLRHQGAALSTWDKLKASTLAKDHHHTVRAGRLLFNLAGRELCELKTNEMAQADLELLADRSDAPRVISKRQWSLMKPRKTKRAQTGPSRTLNVHDDSDDEVLLGDTEHYGDFNIDHVQ
jgi:hypothetical protein